MKNEGLIESRIHFKSLVENNYISLHKKENFLSEDHINLNSKWN